jgi:hypothetical protein
MSCNHDPSGEQSRPGAPDELDRALPVMRHSSNVAGKFKGGQRAKSRLRCGAQGRLTTAILRVISISNACLKFAAPDSGRIWLDARRRNVYKAC